MISNQAYIHPDAKLGKNVTVEPLPYKSTLSTTRSTIWNAAK